MPNSFALYRSVGEVLTQFDVDVERAELTQRGPVVLPGNVQYVWPHPSRKYFYVTTSDGGSGSSGIPGSVFRLAALKVDASGALTPHGEPAVLPTRPIHHCVDATGQYALTAYNHPSQITVHRINADGMVGARVPHGATLDMGIFAHQVMMTPGGRSALLVTRGNNASKTRPEDPGALKFYRFDKGMLTPLASIAPGGKGGLRYGPRHVDFHPHKPWMYASIERQNTIHMHTLEGDVVSAEPLFCKTTLANPQHAGLPRQMCSAIHVHPNGRFVYVANRADHRVKHNGEKVFDVGENNIAVYAIDQTTGEPTLIQHAEAHVYHVRTFSFDPGGRLMVAASIGPMRVRAGSMVVTVPAAMSVYRVGDDGKLTFVRKYDTPVPPGKSQFWSGIVSLG